MSNKRYDDKINNYVIYASGTFELLGTVEKDNLASAKADGFSE